MISPLGSKSELQGSNSKNLNSPTPTVFSHHIITLELSEYYYDTACAFRKTHVVDGNRLKYEGFEALSLRVNS
jgi:hypothetical protein